MNASHTTAAVSGHLCGAGHLPRTLCWVVVIVAAAVCVATHCFFLTRAAIFWRASQSGVSFSRNTRAQRVNGMRGVRLARSFRLRSQDRRVLPQTRPIVLTSTPTFFPRDGTTTKPSTEVATGPGCTFQREGCVVQRRVCHTGRSATDTGVPSCSRRAGRTSDPCRGWQ